MRSRDVLEDAAWGSVLCRIKECRSELSKRRFHGTLILRFCSFSGL